MKPVRVWAVKHRNGTILPDTTDNGCALACRRWTDKIGQDCRDWEYYSELYNVKCVPVTIIEGDPEPTKAEVKSDVDRKVAGAYDDLADAFNKLKDEYQALDVLSEELLERHLALRQDFILCATQNDALRDCIRELIDVETTGYCTRSKCSNYEGGPKCLNTNPCPIDAAWAKARELAGPLPQQPQPNEKEV